MNSFRLNITVPPELKQPLHGVGNKSAFIAEAIREKLEREQEKRLHQELKEGYRATAQEAQALCEEWDVTTGDGLETG